MTGYIVITTINHTDALDQYACISDSELVLVGDKKGPSSSPPNSTLISYGSNLEKSFTINTKLPANHYCRKNLGYLYSMRSNPDHIYETDDDNYPLANWDDIFNTVDQDILISSSDTAFNVYSLYTSEKIWPRGLPLQLISKSPSYEIDFATSSSVSVWQGLANEDPDVDALYRLVSDKEVLLAVLSIRFHTLHLFPLTLRTPFGYGVLLNICIYHQLLIFGLLISFADILLKDCYGRIIGALAFVIQQLSKFVTPTIIWMISLMNFLCTVPLHPLSKHSISTNLAQYQS